MVENLIEQANQWKNVVIPWLGGLLKYAIIATIVLAIVYFVLRILRKPKPAPAAPPDTGIDVKGLLDQGPPPAGPMLYFYNVPVRLAALVLAPAGRARQLPPVNQLDAVADALLPGLSQVIAAHRPVVRRWPAQISSRGFALAFFNQAKLPGEGGKGTPWCAAAGAFKLGKTPIMAGLVMRSAAPTNLGHVIVEQEAQWLDALRVK
jgi:hypothetical protein